ncbi:MAG: hypothetical protein IJW55_07700 [Clostridia bacterium]|nr:hypothetical protein [Clostridia bacterium]
MKKKNDDKQNVADLLKKLQASYLGSSAKSTGKKKKDREDIEDEKFQQQLAAMLGKASEAPAKKQKKEKTEQRSPAPEPSEEPISEVIPVVQAPEPPTEEPPTEESLPTPEPLPKKEKKPRRPKAEKEKPTPVTVETEENTKDTLETVKEAETAPVAEEKPKTDLEERLEVEVPVKETSEKEHTIVPPSDEKPFHPLEKVIPLRVPEKTEGEIEPPTVDDTPPPMEVPVEELPEETVEDKPTEDIPSPIPAPTEVPATEPSKKADSMIFISLRNISPPPIKQEPKPTIMEEKAEPPVIPEKMTEPLPTPPKNEVIKISPPTAPKATEPQKTLPQVKKEPVKEQPIRITPNVTIPARSGAPDFAKQKKDPDEPAPIVIRPNVRDLPEHETIVIRPRTADKPKPVPQVNKEAPAAEPIKIGKEVKTNTDRENIPVRSETPNPIMKKEKNTTLPASAATQHTAFQKEALPPAEDKQEPVKPPKKGTVKKEAVGEEKPRSASKKPGMTMPKSPAKKPSPAPSASKEAKKKSRRVINSIPVTTLSDEDLEEVLDEVPPEEAPAEEIPMDAPEEIVAQPAKLTVFQRRQQKKQQQAEQNLSALEVVRKRSGLSEDDIAMIFELGYENELGRLVGYENLKRLKNEHLKRSGSSNHRHYRTAFGYRGEEFVNTEQSNTVCAAYLHDRKSLLVRLCLTALLTLLSLFADMPHLIGTYLTELGASYPLILPIAGMLMLWAIAALSWRQINAGIRSFFKFTPTPYSVPALLFPVATVYDIASFFASGDMLKVNFLTALSFLTLTVCDVLRLTAEMRTLQLLSADGQRTVLAPAAPRKKKLRQGDKIVKIINDDLGKNMYQVRQAVQTAGFFRRFNSMGSAARPFTVLIAIMFSLSTLSGLADAVYTSSIASALSTFMTVLLLSVPLCACLMYFYPLSRANRLLTQRNCALLGEEAVEEYNLPKTVIFRDSDLYTAEKCTEIAVREGDDFKSDLRLAGILFRKLGGTLKRIGESAPASREDPPVAVVRIQDAGVEAVIDNRYHMVVGNADFLKHSGVRVPRESTDKILRRTATVSLMYVAIDGVLKLSYEIEYRTDASFESLVRDLADIGTSVAIYSYDPNLNETFLQKSRPDADAVHPIKPGRFEEDKPLETVDTGAVSLEERNIVYPLYAAKGIGNLRKFAMRIQLIAALLATAGTAVLSFLGQRDLLGIIPILCYQLLWIVVSVIASFAELNADKLRFRK